MTPHRPLDNAARPRPGVWALLVVALLWAQCLGVWHHTLHARSGLPSAALAAGAAAAAGGTAGSSGIGSGPSAGGLAVPDRHGALPAAVQSPGAEPAGAAAILHHTAGGAECRLLDQLLLGDSAPEAASADVVDLRFTSLPWSASWLLLSQALLRAYLARAPPAC